MSVASARALAATLGGKAPGHLITSDNWNALVSVLLDYGSALDGLPERVTALEAAVTTLDARVDALDGLPARVQALEDQTAPLRQNYKLQVSTTQENFLVGQVAELVFKATQLDGSALPAPMPWLDVVTTWGRLRGAPGFTVRDNAEENALSIQFNAAGEARVQLRSQHTKGVSISEETSFAVAMRAQVGSTGKTVAAVLQDSESPQAAETVQAYKAMHASYAGNRVVKAYADNYVTQYTGGKFNAGKVGAVVQATGEWENYRATVMAFAKPDASPTTPDPTRGVATVQVNFREWISHWSNDFIDDTDAVLPGWLGTVTGNLGRIDLIPIIENELGRRVQQEGVLGQLRNVNALDKALARVNPSTDPVVLQSKALLQGAVQTQRASGNIDTFAMAGYGQQAQASTQIGQTAKAAQATAQDAAGAKQAVVLLETRVKAAEQTGKEISAGIRNIADATGKINVAEVADLGGRLNKINLDLAHIASKIG
jgi:hypothetical protein